MYAIETKNIVKRYGRINVLADINIHVPEKSIYGFVGENGSGKTTLLRILTGLANPTAGTYSIHGVPNTSKKIYEVRQKTSAIVETTSLISSMNARDNLRHACLYLGLKYDEEKISSLLHLVGLDDVGKKKVKNYSLGMRQRLGVALCLINDPDILLLDEPLNGLDPQGIAELRSLLIELNEKKDISILISSHILSELEKIATHYGFIKKRKLIEEISAEDLYKKCQKSLSLKVDNVEKAMDLLRSMNLKNIEYFSKGEIHIYEEITIAVVIEKLSKNDIHIIAIHSKEKSIEDYYLSLVRGANN